MKLCPKCQQPVAEEIGTCPSCGSKIGAGRQYIDDYRIVEVLHEGYASFLCRAVRQRTHEEAMIRLFTPRAGVDEAMALRLKDELEKLKALPDEGFVRHHSIRKSSDGLWYRISEWIDAENWGSLLASGKLSDRALLFDLFYQMASILAMLHEQGYFIPHLILNDIIVAKDGSGAFKVKIDYKLSRFFDPRLDQPGPMLKRLLSCHPDIINRRPLDFRSDIWSLGKIFVELLTADLGCTDFFARIDELQLPPAAQVLIKVMLADDPDLRPRSMAEVAASLARIKSAGIQKTPLPPPKSVRTPVRMIRGLQKRVRLLAVLVAALLVFSGIFAWFQFSYRRSDVASVLEGYANQYAPSVAFVAVEYWLAGKGQQSAYRRILLSWDWRSAAEFQGYLARVLAGLINEKSALKGWYTPSEKSWLYYVVGLKRARRRQWAGAETLMRAAALAADADTWEFFLTRSKLEQLQNLRRKQFQTSTQWNRYNVDVEAFNQTLARSLAQAALRSKKIAALRAQLASEGSQLKDRRAVLEKMVALEPENKNIILALAFYSAAAEDWPQALAYVQTFLEHPGRQNSDRMSLGLLQAGIFHYQGRGKKARQSLKAYNRRTKDPWHRMISDYLLGRQTEDLLKKQAAVSPENLISAYTPMGFWAEGSGDRQKALKYYKEALGSFLDTWVEYNFARERFKRLKKSTG